MTAPPPERMTRTAARRTVINGMAMSVLGTLALAAPVLANDAMPQPWSTGACHLEWCEASVPAASDLDRALQEAADVAELTAGHDCVPASDSRPGVIPAEMVLRQASGDVERVTWTYPAPDGSWVWSLCYGG